MTQMCAWCPAVMPPSRRAAETAGWMTHPDASRYAQPVHHAPISVDPGEWLCPDCVPEVAASA